MVKRCIKCLAMLPIGEFYPNRGMKDGRLNKCIPCVKQYEKERRRINPKVQEYDRARAMLPHRVKARKAYLQTAAGIRARVKAIRNFIKNNPQKRAAHIVVNNALRHGRLHRQPCEVCGSKRVHAHHRDYSKPLEVTWLCTTHHRAEHKAVGKL